MTEASRYKSIMTFKDVADMFSIDIEAVKRLTQSRAQAKPNRIPFFKTPNGEIRFWRYQIMQWRLKVFNGEQIEPRIEPTNRELGLIARQEQATVEELKALLPKKGKVPKGKR
jgi:hypothetical protein